MEYIYPEIALKQPKVDPRTVLLHKRNFMESSSDHIQEEELFHNETSCPHTTTTTAASTAKCDKLTNLCKNSSNSTETTTLVFNNKSLASSSSSSSLLLLKSKLSTSSTSLLSTNLVNFSKSCHFNASLNNLYKLQKTKLLFFLLFIWCAIFLQTTQAIPVRRTTTSGRKLILHTNVYRQRYHQKLLEERKQHNQHQHILQIQQQQLQEIKEQQEQQLTAAFGQQQQQQQQQQVQRNHIYSPNKPLRRVPAQHHRHHLHQRAAPSSSAASSQSQQYKKNMSYCNGNSVYRSLHKQMNYSLSLITQLCKNYLNDRGNDTFETMSETWKLINLQTRNPNRKSISMDNKLNEKIHEFYLNIHSYDQLIDYASNDTTVNKTKIEHEEEISIDTIINFFENVKAQIKFNMQEADHLMDELSIEKPDLNNNIVFFDDTIERRVRDFLIIKNLIEEFERVTQMVNDYCINDDNNNHEE